MGLELAFFVGAVVLLAAIIWGVGANARRNRADDPVREAATRELYKDTEGYDAKEDKFRAQTRH